MKFLSAFALALLCAASMCWPVDLLFVYGTPVWWLQIAATSAFYGLLMQTANAKYRLQLAMLFVTAYLAATFFWLYTAMHTYGGLAAWISAIALLGLAGVLSIYYGAAAYIHCYTRFRGIAVQNLAFAALWGAAELARGTWLTGFGWGAPGYAHTNSPLAAYAPYIGVYGVGAVATWIAATLVTAHKVSRIQCLCAIGILVAGIPLQRLEWTHTNGTLTVALLQGNIAQSEKFEESTGVPEALAWYGQNMMQSTAQLTVAPETAIPLLPQELPPDYWPPLQAQFAGTQRVLMTGIPLGDYQSGYTNSVLAIGGAGTAEYRYDKHHLVPFGEFIPPLFKWFTQMMKIPLGDFNRGAVGQASLVLGKQRLAPNICYEDLFGEELGARFADSDNAPTLFVNVSNLGWFGGGLIIDQHLQISRMRALEFERPFVRATNTGATAIMDHRARVTASLPRMTQGVLQGSVEGRIGITPYAWWVSRLGLWPYWVFIALVLCVALRPKSTDA